MFYVKAPIFKSKEKQKKSHHRSTKPTGPGPGSSSTLKYRGESSRLKNCAESKEGATRSGAGGESKRAKGASSGDSDSKSTGDQLARSKSTGDQRARDSKYAYRQVVRGHAREALPGHTCGQCNKFVDALVRSGAVEEAERQNFLGECSRHKDVHQMSLTPDGYWDLSFADSVEARSIEAARRRTGGDSPN
eukprot:CAMPEP_0185758048 /NCGR_PEP_ID=MMETSP1174-20130828/16591_1 /TAXON_ID=35687 /ORGANISM="Dictyocha speculum, Strain CCMP1381" /LENGTH=190 /DNA_ID=CAMNT_0028437699 /DNA_START=172 /DNA_END=745 /DNA_ORIENTATION=+